MTARAVRLLGLVVEAGELLGDLDPTLRERAQALLRELWVVALEADDPAHFAKLAAHLEDDHQLGRAADLYTHLTPEELLDLHTRAEWAER